MMAQRIEQKETQANSTYKLVIPLRTIPTQTPEIKTTLTHRDRCLHNYHHPDGFHWQWPQTT